MSTRIKLGGVAVAGYNATIHMSETKLRVLITSEQIQTRILELGEKISKDYPDRQSSHDLHPEGRRLFHDRFDARPEARRAHRFHGHLHLRPGQDQFGRSEGHQGSRHLAEGADVLIVEDIVDSGVTLNYLMHVLDQRRPRSIRIAALLDKPERRLRPVHVSYVGFEIPDEFVVGYGLDYAEKYRNLRDICVLEDGDTTPPA